MLPDLHKIKGLHPGLILKRELINSGMKGIELAKSIDEHKQTISAILNLKRNINPALSIKLSKIFNVEEDYFMLLQASYEVKKATNFINNKSTPDRTKFRKVVFWDTDIDKIDWQQNKSAVIQRVLERGNSLEINEIISFYGKKNILLEINKANKNRFPSFQENIKKHQLV